VGLEVKLVGEPDGGNLQVRFDERRRETERCRMAPVTAPFFDSTGKTISMNYEIDLTGSPIFNYIINPDNTFGSGSPGTVRLYFQQVGDNLSGNGAYEFYRWL
jgi:hypothetical protein